MAGSDAIQLPFGRTEPLGAFRPLDALIAGYVVIAAIPLALGTARGVSGCTGQLFVNLAILAGTALICALTRRSRSWPLLLLRLAYVPLLFAVLYRQTAVIWPVLHEQPFDAGLVRLEQALWGTQPSLAFAQVAPWPWLSELFCGAYYAYYYFIPALLFTVLLTRGYAQAERALFATALCFCGCYTLFWLFPVVGPHYWFPPHVGPQLYKGYVFNHLLFLFTSWGEVPAGAFPSSHVAVALVLTLQARHLAPRLFPFMLTVTLLLCAAVVYVKAHYLVDVPAGILTGLLVNAVVDGVSRRRSGQAYPS